MNAFITLILCLFSLNGHAQLLSDEIPYPFYNVQTGGQNKVMSLEYGIAALQLRIDMIKRAKKSIEIEYFIFNTDMAGKIITRELVRAAKRGVRVRMLLDKSKPIYQFDTYYAKELLRYGIEVRYYNAAPLIRISTAQFRNHRKLLVIDDREALTGGRNVADDYYDLSGEFNFNDRDIHVQGPMVKTIRESFDKFFNHEISERPTFPVEPGVFSTSKKRASYKKRTAEAKAFLRPSEEELKIRERVKTIGKPLLKGKKYYVCPTLTFSSDAPGADFKARLNRKFDEEYRFLRKTLYDKLQAVDKRLTLSSPYIIHNDHTRELMHTLLEKNVDITIYTNSVASTDAVFIAANLYLAITDWARLGIKVHLHDGQWLAENDDIEEKIKKAKWGTHSKTQIYETSQYSEVMIGTYNVDNRSNFYNSELAVFCKGNDEFTKEIKEGILSRAHKGVFVNKDGTATDKDGNIKSILGSSDDDFLLMQVLTLPSWLLQFLL